MDNNQVDISVKYLSFFLDDDAELEHIKKVMDALFEWILISSGMFFFTQSSFFPRFL